MIKGNRCGGVDDAVLYKIQERFGLLGSSVALGIRDFSRSSELGKKHLVLKC